MKNKIKNKKKGERLENRLALCSTSEFHTGDKEANIHM